jgi:lysine-specific permease
MKVLPRAELKGTILKRRSPSLDFAVELAASATIIGWWKPVMPDAAWSTIFLVLIIALNMFSVK